MKKLDEQTSKMYNESILIWEKAIREKDISRVQNMISQTNGTNFMDRLGRELLNFAKENGNSEIIEMLQAAGAKE